LGVRARLRHLIRANRRARNWMIVLEQLTDDDLEEVDATPI
jgi:hypothetical protein